MELSGVSTLAERRLEAVRKFAQKMCGQERFKGWFPMRTASKRGTSQVSNHVEMRAHTDRRRNSSLFFFRRLLNEDRIDYIVKKTRIT